MNNSFLWRGGGEGRRGEGRGLEKSDESGRVVLDFYIQGSAVVATAAEARTFLSCDANWAERRQTRRAPAYGGSRAEPGTQAVAASPTRAVVGPRAEATLMQRKWPNYTRGVGAETGAYTLTHTHPHTHTQTHTEGIGTLCALMAVSPGGVV